MCIIYNQDFAETIFITLQQSSVFRDGIDSIADLIGHYYPS